MSLSLSLEVLVWFKNNLESSLLRYPPTLKAVLNLRVISGLSGLRDNEGVSKRIEASYKNLVDTLIIDPSLDASNRDKGSLSEYSSDKDRSSSYSFLDWEADIHTLVRVSNSSND